MQRSGPKVNVIPLEPKQLPLPQARSDGDNVECFKAVDFAAYEFQEGLCLLGRQRAHLFLLDLRGLHGFGDVAGDEAVLHRLFECLVECNVDVSHRTRGVR